MHTCWTLLVLLAIYTINQLIQAANITSWDTHRAGPCCCCPLLQYLLPNPLAYVARTLQLLRDVAQTIFRATDAFIGGVLFQQVINRQGLPGGSLLVTTTIGGGIGGGITPVIIPGAGTEGELLPGRQHPAP